MWSKRDVKIRLMVVVLSVLVMHGTMLGKIIYVDADANGLNDGTSWGDAYNFLQDALDDTGSGAEIRVVPYSMKGTKLLG